MKKIVSLLILGLLLLQVQNFGEDSKQKEVAVTVYNNNLGVIKEVREINISSNESKISITDVAKFIDPTSVHIKLDGEVVEQNYQYDLVSLDKILDKYIDNKISLISENNELIEGTLMSSMGGQIVLKSTDGGLIMIPNVNKYRFTVGSLPNGLITRPTLIWKVNSKSMGKQDVEISYQTQGMDWHAEYVAVLNENDTKLDLNAWVSVNNNSGTTYNNAKLKLVAGDVNRVQERNRMYKGGRKVMAMEADYAAPQFEEKEFFEYHIYNLQRPTTLAQKENKQISLFEAKNINATKKYLYNSTNNYSNGKVNVIVEFYNKKEENLGVPMPKGKVRVNKSDGDSFEFIGEDLIDHTPKNEKIKLKIGNAFDILAEERMVENKRITNKIYEQIQEIKIKNRKNEKIYVEVEKHLGLNWEILDSSLKYKKKNAQTITFNVPVKKDDETVLTYKVRYSH